MNYSFSDFKNTLTIDIEKLCFLDKDINEILVFIKELEASADKSAVIEFNFSETLNLCECEICIEKFRAYLMKKYDVANRKKISTIDFNFVSLENEETAQYEYHQYVSKKLVKVFSMIIESVLQKFAHVKINTDFNLAMQYCNLYELAQNFVTKPVSFGDTTDNECASLLQECFNDIVLEKQIKSNAIIYVDYFSLLAIEDKQSYFEQLHLLYDKFKQEMDCKIVFSKSDFVNSGAEYLVLFNNVVFSKQLYFAIKEFETEQNNVLVFGDIFNIDLQLRDISYLREEIFDFKFKRFDEKLLDCDDLLAEIHTDTNVGKKKKYSLKKFLIVVATIIFLGIGLWCEFAYSQIGFIKTTRELFIGTAMTTATKKWLAEWFLPASEIERVMALANPEITEKTNDEEIDALIDLSGIVGTSTPHPKRPLKITRLEAEDILKIQKIKTNGSTTGTMYIREAIVGASVTVAAKDRYKYTYPSAKRYLVEKGMDSFYVDIVEVQNALFKGKMIVVSDPSKVILSSTKKLGIEGEPLPTLIKNVKGIGGINAAGYKDAGWVGNGGQPNGLVISQGKKLHGKSWRTVVGFNKKNKLIVGNYTSAELKKLKLRDAVEFTPALIINGKPQLSYGSNAATGIHPRTVIGQRKDGDVILLTIDGRQAGSVGASNYDCMNILLENGCVNACNLDGGHSTYMMWRNKFINKPYQARYDKKLANAFVVVP